MDWSILHSQIYVDLSLGFLRPREHEWKAISFLPEENGVQSCPQFQYRRSISIQSVLSVNIWFDLQAAKLDRAY